MAIMIDVEERPDEDRPRPAGVMMLPEDWGRLPEVERPAREGREERRY